MSSINVASAPIAPTNNVKIGRTNNKGSNAKIRGTIANIVPTLTPLLVMVFERGSIIPAKKPPIASPTADIIFEPLSIIASKSNPSKAFSRRATSADIIATTATITSITRPNATAALNIPAKGTELLPPGILSNAKVIPPIIANNAAKVKKTLAIPCNMPMDFVGLV